MQLRYISVPLLIGAAGEDPWAVNQSLQAGRPAQIADLAAAFHAAGQCTNESNAAFDEARRRFTSSWNRQHGENPINDSAEVQRTIQMLGAALKQLPKIGVDLENIAAALAQAQRYASGQIARLEAQLERLDDLIGQALKQEADTTLTVSDRDALNAFIALCEDDAIQDTKNILDELDSTRRCYTDTLQKAQTALADDGYDPGAVFGADAHEPETPDRAEKDVQLALGGNKGAAARVNAALSSITPDQLAGKVPFNAGQAAVLSQLQAQEHGMSIEALHTAEQRLGGQKGMIGDSLQLMSNPNLVFPSTPLTVGARQRSETVKGGAAQLPDSIQQVLAAPDFVYADQTKVIADIVHDGNPALQANTTLDQGLLRKAARIMNAPLWQRNVFESQVSSVFAAAGRDHGAVSWMLHQQAPAADASTKNFLQNITHHTWLDGGAAAGALFSWTQNPTTAETHLAGQTAQDYATYLGENSQDLLHLPGNHTLGQLNPELVQAMAHGLGPYVNNIADTSGGMAEFGDPLKHPGALAGGQISVAKGLFSVLDSDKDAAQYFNGQAYAQAVLHNHAFASDPVHSSYNHQLYDAATLQALVDIGTNNAFQANAENGYHQGLSEYESKKLAYEDAVLGASAMGRFIPGAGGLAGPGIGIFGHSLENDILGPAPTSPTENPMPRMDIGSADREILDAMLGAQHTIVGLPPAYIAHDHDHPYGRIAALDEVRLTQPGLSPGEYGEVIGVALTQALQPRSPGELPPDQYLTDRYNDVVVVPRPTPADK